MDTQREEIREQEQRIEKRKKRHEETKGMTVR